MKAKLKIFAAAACATLCAFSMTACSEGQGGKSTQLGKPSDSITLPDREKEGYKGFVNAVDDFSATFAQYAYADYNKGGNFTVSPVSVYMALSLAAECAAGDTREEILSALGVSYEQLAEHFSAFYSSLEVEHKSKEYDFENKSYKDVTTGLVDLTNSIWVNEGTEVKQNCIDRLSEYYQSYSFSADFAFDNAAANQAVREFVKENTRGLIDKDFNLSDTTLFALINTLYLKTIWNEYGDLSFTKEDYAFKNKNGTEKLTKLLKGGYASGRVAEYEKFNTFFSSTSDEYKLKFIVPKDGYGVDDVFTAENLVKVNSVADYRAVNEEAKIKYFTRCIFPEFKASYDEDVSKILKEKYGIDKFFNDPGSFPKDKSCDFSNLSDAGCFCSRVHHVTDLTVDKTGIEGAAVTVIAVDGATAPKYEYVFQDFVIDRAFGFIITDKNDVTLFSGVVENI